jgi:hypothetical protein
MTPLFVIKILLVTNTKNDTIWNRYLTMGADLNS